MRQVLVGAMWAICILVLYSVYPRQTYSGYAQLEANASGMQWKEMYVLEPSTGMSLYCMLTLKTHFS